MWRTTDLSDFVTEKTKLLPEEEVRLARQRIAAEQACCIELYSTDVGRTLLAYALNIVLKKKAKTIQNQFPAEEGYQAWYDLIKTTQQSLRKQHEAGIRQSADEQKIIAERISTLPLAHVLFPTIFSTISERKGTSVRMLFTQTKKFQRTHREKAVKLYAEYKKTIDKLVEHNLRLAIHFAKSHSTSPDFDDLISFGHDGLTYAASIYDPDANEDSKTHKKPRFSTHAAYWIKNSIQRRGHEISRNVRFPHHVPELVRKIDDYKNMFANKYYREPTLEEISAGLEVSLDSVKTAFDYEKEEASFDKPIGSDGEETLYDQIEDKKSGTQTEKQELVLQAFKKLRKRLRRVLEDRTGINGRRPKTLEECGALYKVSRQRVAELEVYALKKLAIELEKNDEAMAEYGEPLPYDEMTIGVSPRGKAGYQKIELLTLKNLCARIRRCDIKEFVKEFYQG